MCETPIQRSNKNGMVKILRGRIIKKKKNREILLENIWTVKKSDVISFCRRCFGCRVKENQRVTLGICDLCKDWIISKKTKIVVDLKNPEKFVGKLIMRMTTKGLWPQNSIHCLA